jgi:hypothetical protein
LKAAVTPVEPPELKAEVAAIGAEDKSDADRVAEIKEALMKLDEAKLMSLKTALEGVPKEGGDPSPEEMRAVLARREERKAELARRIADAKRPLGEKIRHTSGDLLRGLMIVFAGAVSSAVGNARRRRTRRA